MGERGLWNNSWVKNLPVSPLALRRKTPGQLYPTFRPPTGRAKNFNLVFIIRIEMLLLLLLFKEWNNILLRYHFWSIKISCTIQTRCCKTLHNPQPNQVHMMSHITCPLIKVPVLCDAIQPALVCPVLLPSQLSCLPSSLSSPLSSCLVLGACYVIQLVDLYPSSVQHYCTLINANLH